MRSSPLPRLAAFARFGALALFAVLLCEARPAAAQQFLANQIQNLISTDTMKVEITGLSGALTGNLRIDSVTVSDPKGVFLTARDLAMDWSPLAVVRSRIDVESLTAGQIVFERLPETPPADPNAPASSGGGLPNITADIQRIAVQEVVLGEAIAGTRARLSANARLVLDKDPTRVEANLAVERLDQPGTVAANVVFAPADNRLEIKVEANEPAGGLVANLLKLPGAPPVALTVNGSGPLADFMANGQLTVDAEPAAMLTARVADQPEGRRVTASLNVAAARFVPDAYQAYVDGGANLDLALLLRPDGVIGIDQAQLASGQISAVVSGTLDRAGPRTALDVAISARDGGAIPLRFGTAPNQTVVDITALQGKIAGALAAASVDLTASLPTAGFGAYVAKDVAASVKSPGFNLTGLDGPLQIQLDAASMAAPEGVADRFLKGPIRIAADGALTAEGLTLSRSKVTTKVANAAVTGAAALNFSTFDLTLSSDFDTLALSAALLPLAGDRLSVGGHIVRTADGALAANNLALSGTGLTVTGTAGLAGGQVNADVTGIIDAQAAADATISGKAEFKLTARGPSAQPDVDISLTSQGLRVNGRELANLKVEARGDFASGQPAGSVAITGELDGAPLSGSAKLETLPSGERRMSQLAIRQGTNSITGEILLSEKGPVGDLDVALADVGPLAALALQKMSGDLNGQIGLTVNDRDFPVATLDLASDSLAVGGNTLKGLGVQLAVEDYLGAPFPAGAIRAEQLVAGGATVEAAAIDLARRGDYTQIDAKARANGIPVTLSGQAQITAAETIIALDSLTAAIRDADVALAKRATVWIADGTTKLDALTLKVGAGSIAVSGTAGATLDLTARLTDVPAALANPFVANLDASGVINGNAAVNGASNDPQARFEIAAVAIETRHTRAARLEPVVATASGQYAQGTLDLQGADIDLGSGRVTASGRVGDTLALNADLDNVPVALANGFVDGLNASGTISGTARAGGTVSAPEASFALTGTGITAAEVAAAGVPPVEVDVAGSYAGTLLTLERARATVGAGSLTASGTAGDMLDLSVVMTELPVGLVNGFVPGLKASGTLSGTATATGPRTAPRAEFDISGSGITAAEVKAGGIPPMTLRLAGNYADGTATLETATANLGEASLTATGSVGQLLNLDVILNRIPVGLANGFVPGLKASGTISGTARATGTLQDPNARFALTGTGISAERIAASGIDPLSLDIAGSIANRTATIETARVRVGEGSLTATGTVGEALNLSVEMDNLPVGLVNGFVPNLDASGTLSGKARATGSLASPEAEFTLTGSGITAAQVKAAGVEPIALNVDGSYAGGSATLRSARADIGKASLTAKGTVGQTLDLDVVLDALPVALVNGFMPELKASGTLSGSAKATGALADPAATFQITGAGITAAQVKAAGVAPIGLDIAGKYAAGTATLDRARAVIGEGSLSATGSIGQALDVDVTLDRLPVGLANGFVPDLGARGTLSGSARATGSLADPDARFDIAADNVATRQTLAAGAPAIDAVAKGTYRNAAVAIETARLTVGSGTVTISGTAGQNLDLTVAIADIPASLASAAAPGINPAGSIDGTVRATGAASNPDIAYDLRAGGLSIAQTRDAGVGPVDITANGRFANKALTVAASLSGSGLAFRADGSVNLAGSQPQLDLALNGTAPLAIANRILAEGGRSVKGTVAVNATVRGTPNAPDVNGTISTAGASFTDTGANVAVNGINATIALSGQTATIQSFSASLAAGGTLRIGGTVGLANGFPADIRIQLADGRYNDGETIAARLGADLRITGPLTGSPLLSGRVDATGIDVLVPERLPSSLARIEVKHKNAPRAVIEQARKIEPKGSGGAGSSAGLTLDVVFSAPNRVFVRGRGLDIELGGSVRITGSASAPGITGGFELQRGRFTILSNRLDFQRGRLTFTGDLVPTLDLLATSDSGGVTVSVAVTGPANDPAFNFSSTPALPQDEVLARLIFGQGTANLSPLQIAQLAEAASQLAGVGGSNGLLENLRSQIGVDDLDIKTNADGQTAVGVGKYLSDNAYLGVDSTGRVSIDLDLGKGLKARGAVSATGGGEVGVFYENEY